MEEIQILILRYKIISTVRFFLLKFLTGLVAGALFLAQRWADRLVLAAAAVVQVRQVNLCADPLVGELCRPCPV
jgi:hypothetical protein